MHIIHKQIFPAEQCFTQALHFVLFNHLPGTREIRVLADTPLRAAINWERKYVTKQCWRQHHLSTSSIATLVHLAAREHLAKGEFGLAGELDRPSHMHHGAWCGLHHDIGGLEIERQCSVGVAVGDCVRSARERSHV